MIQLFAATPLSVGELADIIGSSLPTVSELIGELEGSGLVNRQVDPANRRRTLVTLAEKHSDQFGEFVALRAAPLLRALDRLTIEQREGFIEGLRLWVDETRDGSNSSPTAKRYPPSL